MSWARRLRRDLGATPIAGEVLAEFRYLLLYIGTRDEGARLELLEPTGPGFLTRYLSRHGEGPHHLTFSVPDLHAACATARSLGATVVGENYDHPPWREAFLLPDDKHAIVIQLAQSDRTYPGPDELLATQARNTASFPSTSGAVDPLWWTPVWDTPSGSQARLGTTHLASTDLEFSRRLFYDLLCGRMQERPEHVDFTWPGGSVRVHSSDHAGLMGMSLYDSTAENLRIGSAWLGPGNDRG